MVKCACLCPSESCRQLLLYLKAKGIDLFMFFESLELNLSRDNYLQSHKVMEIYSGEVTSKKPLGL
jgi:hypothetical protein